MDKEMIYMISPLPSIVGVLEYRNRNTEGCYCGSEA